MTDPFLKAHQLGPFLFSIGGNIGPTVSIRDQMIRGNMLVDRLIQEKILIADNEQQPPLVVIGAGAGGATAALRAFGFKIPVILVERQKAPFAVQANCQTRWVDPVMYDWPMDHYAQGQIPWPAPPRQTPFPLPWTGNFAQVLAGNWSAILRGALPAQAQRFEHDFLNAFTSIPQATAGLGPVLIVQINDRKKQKPEYVPASAAVLAIGFGKERCWAGSDKHPDPARGYSFWDDDRWYHANFGQSRQRAKVLISGAGDGALQDFIRVTTRNLVDQATGWKFHSARAIYDYCGIPLDIEHDLQSHQDYAQRLLVWGGSKQFEHAVQQELQDAHDRLASVALAAPGVVGKLNNVVWARNELPFVRLYYGCSHFTNMYPLNRFLTLLLAKFFEQEYGIADMLQPRHRLKRLNCLKHPTPTHDPPQDCWGQDHLATFDWQPRCWEDAVAAKEPPTFAPNVLFIRHGIQSFDFEKRITPPFAKQMVPYSLPRL